jgi:murein L,D-transpeptidase YcbB/YkuD
MRRKMIKTILFKCVLPIIFISFLWTYSFSSQKSSDPYLLSGQTSEFIHVFISTSDDIPGYSPGGEPLYAASMLHRFYTRRNFKPAWINDEGLSKDGELLLAAIEETENHGLNPEYYHADMIESLMEQVQTVSLVSLLQNPEVLVELDVLLTDAFLLMGCHFSAGCVNPLTIDVEWFANRYDLNIDLILEDALKENTIQETLKELLPSQQGYSQLRQRLISYREIAKNGGWPTVPGDGILKRGTLNNQIIALKKRLIASGDLNGDGNSKNEVFNRDLEKAVVRFQKRHGLDADGRVGPFTRQALNVPAERRVQQIEVNLERVRWTARSLGHRYILVNIADFTMDVIEHGRPVMSMDVVVGKPFWNTPIFTKKMTHFVLNPSWNVPDSITAEELLPKIKHDPDYLKKQNIKILRRWSANAEEIAPESISWAAMDADTFPYRLRQEPGPLNPLGRIKFMFPNKYNIYLHDTPAKGLFSNNVRAFSHGCIRIKRPIDFTEYLLQGDPEWTREKILLAIESGEQIEVRLPQRIPVHIVYLTAWVDEAGIVHFRDDIYGRDEQLSRALNQRSPESIQASKEDSNSLLLMPQ